MKFSYVSNLYCPKCSKEYESDKVQNLCECGSPLLVNYDLDTLKNDWDPSHLAKRDSNLWRYHELLQVEKEENVVSLGEGMTPLIKMPLIGTDMGIDNLSLALH